jgi:hypothetical protein
MKLMEVLDRSKIAGDEEKQMLAQIIQMFHALVDRLGEAPGAPGSSPQNRGAGIAPVEAGGSKVRPAGPGGY